MRLHSPRTTVLASRVAIPTAQAARFRLRDGRVVGIAPITPAARTIIAAAMAHLSPETSRRRFFTVRYRLSERELDELTNVDGVERYALGATVERAGGGVDGVGVARYSRMANVAGAAEVAVLVVDAYQGQGVGRMLLRRLAEAAVVRGVVRFHGIVLSDNDPMLGLLRKHTPGATLRRDHDYLNVEVELPKPPSH